MKVLNKSIRQKSFDQYSNLRRTNRSHYTVDVENEVRRINLLKSRLNGKIFRNNERSREIFEQNLHIQGRLDQIKEKDKGSYNQVNLKVPNQCKASFSNEKRGSLNYQFKRSEERKINDQNAMLALRLVNQKPTLNFKELEEQFKQEQKRK